MASAHSAPSVLADSPESNEEGPAAAPLATLHDLPDALIAVIVWLAGREAW